MTDTLAVQNIKQSATHPKFLHSNSTSHVWAFSAIAELIDNSCDPDVQASELHIDVEGEWGEYRLVFADDGFGMSPAKLHKMLSFGYCEKVEVNGVKPIGHYGNGFKSGSMRLGKDALVLTKDRERITCGFLSQTFLAAINADAVLVPIVSWTLKKELIPDKDAQESLSAILRYSPFNTINDLLIQFERIKKTGTVIVVSNMRKEGDSVEFDFAENPVDVRIRSDQQVVGGASRKFQRHRVNQDINIDIPLDYSLRAYCEVLYLRPRMKIYIRGIKVRTKLIAHSLSHTKNDSYKPYGCPQPVKITYGINAENKYVYGIMLYHRNRLIKPYVRVGIQLQHGKEGVGVIGIIEADFLQPTHNKQDFDFTPQYRNCMNKLAELLALYWQSMKNPKLPPKPVASTSTTSTTPTAAAAQAVSEYGYLEAEQEPDEIWAQCDGCLKWRKLPSHVKPESLPDRWYCVNNIWDPLRNTCTAPQQEDDPAAVPDLSNYRKQVKEVEKAEARRLKELASKRELEVAALEAQRREQEIRMKNEALVQQARAAHLLQTQREHREKEYNAQLASIQAKEKALAERELQIKEESRKKAIEFAAAAKLVEEKRLKLEEEARRKAIQEEHQRKLEEEKSKKAEELAMWFAQQEKSIKRPIKEENPASPKKIKSNPDFDLIVIEDMPSSPGSPPPTPKSKSPPPAKQPVPSMVIKTNKPSVAHSTPTQPPTNKPPSITSSKANNVVKVNPAVQSHAQSQMLVFSPGLSQSTSLPLPTTNTNTIPTHSQAMSNQQDPCLKDYYNISRSMAVILKGLGSAEFFAPFGPDAGTKLEKADPSFLASVNANQFVESITKHFQTDTRSHLDLAELRHWVKRLLNILARKKNIELEGTELDSYFVEWVKRQEARTGTEEQ